MTLNRENRFLAIIANTVSIIFQPLLMPTLAFAILLYGYPTLLPDYSFKVKLNLLIFIALITLLVPVLAILILYKSGLVSSLMMKERKERFLPMFFTSIIYAALAYLFLTKLYINPLFSNVMISIAFVTFITSFITYFWQISVHSTSVGGLVSLLFLLNIHVENESMFILMLGLITLSGIVMSARLYLNAHNIWQVMVGYAIGFGVNISIILRLFGEI